MRSPLSARDDIAAEVTRGAAPSGSAIAHDRSVAVSAREPEGAGSHAYCATPFPNDQFSFATSTSETRTSSRLTPGEVASSSAMRA
jgi:hypothetical protein